MKKAKINTEFLDYDVMASGFIISGEVLNFNMSILGVDESTVPADDVERLEEHCKQELLDSVYSPELEF